jgi:hypothetical protein
VAPINQCSIVFNKDQAYRWIENVCNAAPTPAPTPAGPAFVIYATGQDFPSGPSGYVQASLADIKSKAFLDYYNAHKLNDLSQMMGGCCIFNLTDGFLTYESKYLFPYTTAGQRQCYEQLTNPVYFGAGWYTDIPLSTISAADVAKLDVNTAQFCADPQPNTFAIFKLGSGPGPSPPGPNPPAPTPQPASGTFVQMTCQDSACSQGCQNNTFKLNTCLPLNGGGSAIAQCNSQGVLLTVYESSSTCTGSSTPDQMPTNQCLQDNTGSYLENFCSSSSFAAASANKKVLRTRQ